MRTDISRYDYDKTGFHNKDICKNCLNKLKDGGIGVAGETKNIKCCEYGKYMVGENGYCVYGEKECAE